MLPEEIEDLVDRRQGKLQQRQILRLDIRTSGPDPGKLGGQVIIILRGKILFRYQDTPQLFRLPK